MSYTSLLRASVRKHNSLLCLGVDIPPSLLTGSPSFYVGIVLSFYETFLHKLEKLSLLPAAVKINLAHLEAAPYHAPTIKAELTRMAKDLGLVVIHDGKRGDVSSSAKEYAKSSYRVPPNPYSIPDAVTVNPYMGTDSISPFLSYAEEDKGTYILVRTSNTGGLQFRTFSFSMENPFI